MMYVLHPKSPLLLLCLKELSPPQILFDIKQQLQKSNDPTIALSIDKCFIFLYQRENEVVSRTQTCLFFFPYVAKG